MTHLQRIRQKLELLRARDPDFTLFGAERHQYQLNPPLPLHQLQAFQQATHTLLPPSYAQFLTELGNGGAGPFYGLEPLENALYDDLDYKSSDLLLNPALPFPHLQAWNPAFNSAADEDSEEYESEREAFEDDYFNPSHLAGAIAICNYGCGINICLVVNGPERGNLWFDDRVNGQGIYPLPELGNAGRLGFLAWYEHWLDTALAEIADA